MKLYLSSYHIPVVSELIDLVGKPATKTRVALIPNAKDYYAERARAVKIRDVTSYFKKLGFLITVVDLRDYNDPAELTKKLAGFDLIWAMGGNTFILRHEMQRSGFDKAILGLLQQGKVYGGDSAGALVAGNDLHGVEFVDNPEFAEKVIWNGMCLTNHFVLPHVGSTELGTAIEDAWQMHKADKTLITLTDAQALVISDTAMKIVSAV